jgi:hypothetical protein
MNTMRNSSSKRRIRKLGFENLEAREMLAIDLVSNVPGTNVATSLGSPGFRSSDISDDGRLVAFNSPPLNGVLARDAIVVKDLSTGSTKIATAGPTGVLVDSIYLGSHYLNDELNMSSDGRYVAFGSRWHQDPPLIPGDSGESGLFVKDLQTDNLVRIPLQRSDTSLPDNFALSDDGRSMILDGGVVLNDGVVGKRLYKIDIATNAAIAITPPFYHGFEQLRVRGNGRYVLFSSLGELEAGNIQNVYLKDLVTGSLTIVSTNATGQPGNGSSGDGLSDISADGRYVAFSSSATNLVPGTPTSSVNVFVKDLQTGTVRVASSDALGDFSRQESSGGDVGVSADGRYVSFDSNNYFLVAGTFRGPSYLREAYVKDMLTGAITRVTSNNAGLQVDGGIFGGSVELSRDGRFASFVDSGIYAGIDTNDGPDAFRANVDFSNSLVSQFNLAGAPTTWRLGESKVYNVTVTNRGTATWLNSGPNPVNLGVYIDGLSDDMYHWNSEPIRVSLPRAVAPGESVTLQVTIKAPLQNGEFVLRHRMVQEHRAWFAQIGKVHPTFSVDATYVNDTPTIMTPGERRTFGVTVTNNSDAVWLASGANPVHLGVYDSGRSDEIYDWITEPTRYELPHDVQPGQSATIIVSYTAPTTGNNVVLRSRLVTEHVAWFREVSTKTIAVGTFEVNPAAFEEATVPSGQAFGYWVTLAQRRERF